MEIVKVKFLNDQGEATGRSYSYFTEDPLGLGEIVQVPVTGRGDLPSEHMVKSAVVEVNVPEAEIAAFRDRVKTIPSGSKRPPTQAADFIPATEVELPPAETPPVAQVASLFDTPPGADHGEPTTTREMEPEPGAERFNPDDIMGRLEVDEAASAEAGTLVGDIAPNPDFVPEPGPAWPDALVPIENKFGPPTASALYQLYSQAAGLLDYAKKRVIATNEDLKPATDDLAIILQCRKDMEARKAELVGPMRAELDRFYQAFNDLMAPVLEAEKLTKSKVAQFDIDQRRKAAEARRIEDEKNRLAREEAALNGTGEITVPLGTAEAPPPVPERTRTDMGTMYGRDNWKARVVDFAALPDEFKLADMSALNAKAKSSKGTAEIPGVEFYNDRIYQARTK